MILTIDTFAWIEMIRGSLLGRRAQVAMEGAELCLTPSIVLAEIASKCVKDGIPDPVVLQELRAIREASEVVPLDDSIAIAGAHTVVELRRAAREQRLPLPGLADGLVLATARLSRARLLTGDPHFRSCPETVWMA